MNETAVRIRGLVAGYGGPPVLDGLDLDVAPATLVAVLGASGSGKTTLLRAIAGFLRPTAGDISIGGTRVAGSGTFVPPERRRVGIVPQEGALFPHLDVRGNIAFGLAGIARHGRDARVDELLELIGLPGMGALRPQELSGGQQQRVALARALAPEPEVVLLDEPFSALDASLRSSLRTEVRELLRTSGTTAILVTHDQEEALATADVVAIMRDGRLVQVDAPSAVYASPADLGVARFVGDLVEVPVLAAGDGAAHTALGSIALQDAVTIGDVIALRPEQLSVTAEEDAQVTSAASAAGTLVSRSYHGHDSLLEVALDDSTIVSVRVPGDPGLTPGDRVRVTVRGTARAFRAR